MLDGSKQLLKGKLELFAKECPQGSLNKRKEDVIEVRWEDPGRKDWELEHCDIYTERKDV